MVGATYQPCSTCECQHHAAVSMISAAAVDCECCLCSLKTVLVTQKGWASLVPAAQMPQMLLTLRLKVGLSWYHSHSCFLKYFKAVSLLFNLSESFLQQRNIIWMAYILIPTHGEKDQLKGFTLTNNDAKSLDVSQKVPQKDEKPGFFGGYYFLWPITFTATALHRSLTRMKFPAFDLLSALNHM